MISPTIRSNTSGTNTFSVWYPLWSRNRLWSNFVELQVRWCPLESRREQNISSLPLEIDAQLWFDIRIPCRRFAQLPTDPWSHRSCWTRVTLQPDTSTMTHLKGHTAATYQSDSTCWESSKISGSSAYLIFSAGGVSAPEPAKTEGMEMAIKVSR